MIHDVDLHSRALVSERSVYVRARSPLDVVAGNGLLLAAVCISQTQDARLDLSCKRNRTTALVINEGQPENYEQVTHIATPDARDITFHSAIPYCSLDKLSSRPS